MSDDGPSPIVYVAVGFVFICFILGIFMLGGCASTPEQPRPYFEKSSEETQIA